MNVNIISIHRLDLYFLGSVVYLLINVRLVAAPFWSVRKITTRGLGTAYKALSCSRACPTVEGEEGGGGSSLEVYGFYQIWQHTKYFFFRSHCILMLCVEYLFFNFSKYMYLFIMIYWFSIQYRSPDEDLCIYLLTWFRCLTLTS